jgi:hypothetical protein
VPIKSRSIFLLCWTLAPTLGLAQAQTSAERKASLVLEDVCTALACDASRLQSTVRPVQRVAELREAASGATLAPLYAALETPRDPAVPLDENAALVTVKRILAGECAPCAGDEGATLGIPQKETRHPHPYLLERSMLFPFQQSLILEAQVAPHLYFYENLTKEEGVELHGGNAMGVSVTPMFKVRIRHEKSSPVQTLSFMPKLNLQYFRFPRRTKLDDPWADVVWLKGGLFVWGHHSNGQTECLYQQERTDADCPPPSSPTDVRINYPNGSFSTNYLKFAVFTTRIRLGPTVAEGGPFATQIARKKTTFSASLELNPPGLPPGGSLEEPARSLYGPTRVGVTVEHEQRIKPRSFWTGSWRLTGSVDYIDKVADVGSSNWRFTVEGAWEPDWFRSGGFVARYVHGQDYYNLQFDRDIHWFQLGLVFSASEFERFLSKR